MTARISIDRAPCNCALPEGAPVHYHYSARDDEIEKVGRGTVTEEFFADIFDRDFDRLRAYLEELVPNLYSPS